MAPLTVALLGLGEAGSALAGDLVAAGVFVRGFDPAAGDDVPGVHRAADARAAVDGSDVVLSVTAASAALDAAGSAAGGLRAGQVYADLNASGAALKRAVAEVVAPTGAQFADVALMGVVPRDGLRTPALVSGPGRGGLRRAPAPARHARRGPGRRAGRRGGPQAAAQRLHEGPGGLVPGEPARRARGGLRGLDARGDRGRAHRRRRRAARAPGHRQRAPRDAPHRRGPRRPRAAGRARRRAARDRRRRRLAAQLESEGSDDGDR